MSFPFRSYLVRECGIKWLEIRSLVDRMLCDERRHIVGLTVQVWRNREREASRNDVTLDGSPIHLESICLNTTLHILLFLVFFCRYGLLASFVDEIYV